MALLYHIVDSFIDTNPLLWQHKLSCLKVNGLNTHWEELLYMSTALGAALAQASYFEDLVQGQRFETDPLNGVLVTVDKIRAFAEITGDKNPLHLDEAAAAAGPYGTIIAHGALVYSLAVGMASQIQDFAGSMPVFREISEFTFLHPVLANDRIGLTLIITNLSPLRANMPGKVICLVQISNENNAVVADGKLTLLVRKRGGEIPA